MLWPLVAFDDLNSFFLVILNELKVECVLRFDEFMRIFLGQWDSWIWWSRFVFLVINV
jgi:hypothetical protein